MRMIVINPETPTGVFCKAGVIAQDSEAGIFLGQRPCESAETLRLTTLRRE
jgi:hypothetical protein